MLQRCGNPKDDAYRYYGARGIRVLWPDFASFRADMLPSYQPGLTIDRINNDGHYCKENCRWATRKEQNNNSRNNHRLRFKDENLTLTEWATRLKMTPETLRNRLSLGWPLSRALTESVRPLRPRRTYLMNRETVRPTEWARRIGIKPSTLYSRLYLGWSVKRALTTPVGR